MTSQISPKSFILVQLLKKPSAWCYSCAHTKLNFTFYRGSTAACLNGLDNVIEALGMVFPSLIAAVQFELVLPPRMCCPYLQNSFTRGGLKSEMLGVMLEVWKQPAGTCDGTISTSCFN